jgi:hypothetical protein
VGQQFWGVGKLYIADVTLGDWHQLVQRVIDLVALRLNSLSQLRNEFRQFGEPMLEDRATSSTRVASLAITSFASYFYLWQGLFFCNYHEVRGCHTPRRHVTQRRPMLSFDNGGLFIIIIMILL